MGRLKPPLKLKFNFYLCKTLEKNILAKIFSKQKNLYQREVYQSMR